MLKLDIQMFAEGKVIIEADLETKSFEAQIEETERRLKRLENEYQIYSHQAERGSKTAKSAMRETALEIEKTSNKLVQLRTQQAKIANQGFDKMKKSLEDVGSSLKGVITKVGKWGLALFGIRSIYSMIRSAMSTIASEDEQIATDIEYMKWVLAQTVKPIVEWIIKGLYTIMYLINSIAKAIFKTNLLSGKSAEDFKSMKASAGGVASNLKEARKQLAGFDEINVLNDNGTVNGLGGGGGISGSWEMPNFNETEQKIQKFKTEWINFTDEMRTSIDDMPLYVWDAGFGEWGLGIRGATETVYGLTEEVESFPHTVGGIGSIIKGIVAGDGDEIKKGVIETIDGIWEYLDSKIRIGKGLLDFVSGVILGVVSTLISKIIDLNNRLWNWISTRITAGLQRIKLELNKFIGKVQGLLNEVLGHFGEFGAKVGSAVGFAFKSQINSMLGFVEMILNQPINSINALIDLINSLPTKSKMSRLNNIYFPRLAQGGIVNNPGRGVMMGSYIAGENGPEAVLPLTDDTLQKLANMIPITVNVTNTMNGRVISRELQKVQNQNDFAYNG